MIATVVLAAPLLGAVAGSFTATAVVRTLDGRQALGGRSACDGCGMTLGYAQTLPVVSYFAEGGACRACRRPIDPLHPIGELAGAALGGSVLLAIGAGMAPISAVLMTGLGFALLAMSLFDLRTQCLPDILTLIVAVGCAGLALGSRSGTLLAGVAWSLGVLVALSAVRWAFQRLRGDPGLGLGDVKLLAALALWLGPATPLVLALASGAALAWRLVRREGGRAPFGPWIAAAAWGVGLVVEIKPWAA